MPAYQSVADADGGAAIVDTAVREFGRLDVVVNNAGILRNQSFGEMTHDQLMGVLGTHLLGSFYVSQPAFRIMREQGYGRFVFTSSGSGLFGLRQSGELRVGESRDRRIVERDRARRRRTRDHGRT